jgi:hypothetical protein
MFGRSIITLEGDDRIIGAFLSEKDYVQLYDVEECGFKTISIV